MRAHLFFLAAGTLAAQSQDPAEFFEKKVRPVLASKCQVCHGAKSQMGGLNLASGADAVRVAKSGRLLEVLGYESAVKMPPGGKLSAAEIADFKTWVDTGAAWPGGTVTAEAPKGKRITDADRAHWAFRPVKDYAPPVVRSAAWVKGPIDRFILAKLEESKLKPAPPASKLTLLRRVTYDLTGLPPTPEEADAFLADSSADAFTKVVDRLLASPRYGERWGRHWLDVARYADSTGMDEDHLYPHAWRYRDWVIDSFNKDTPYDQFVMEQIAGDRLPRPNPVATGFLALGPKPLAQQDRVKMIYDVVDEQIDVTSKAFLGLTLACARCHDHKFDPLLARDYYAMAGMFASSTNFRNLGRPGAVSYIYYEPLDREAYARYQDHRSRVYAKQMEMEEVLGGDLEAKAKEWEARLASDIVTAWKVQRGAKAPTGTDAVTLARWLCYLDPNDPKPHLKTYYEAGEGSIEQVAREMSASYSASAKKWLEQLANWRKRYREEVKLDRDLPARPAFDPDKDPLFAGISFKDGPFAYSDSPRVAALRAEYQKLKDTLPEEPPMASAVTDGEIVDQKIFVRGDHHSPGEPAPKTFPVVLAGESQEPVHQGSGRLELARWLARADNPLTARVMVNRVWQWHFGEALVRTPNNWGRTGEKPTHPELLDYLARRFVESGWSVKSLHRLILLSNAYQMSSVAHPEAKKADPSNRLWSHFNRQRLTVEAIRDSLLSFDGSLDETRGGSLLSSGKRKRDEASPDSVRRRTVYLPVRRGSMPVLLSIFDFGDATTSTEGRTRTNVAPQALFILNSEFVQERARGMAQRLLDAAGADGSRIDRAYLTVLGRPPAADEADRALTYIASLQQRLDGPDARLRAWQSFCHVLMSANEFVYLD